jgi:hypothetical protein
VIRGGRPSLSPVVALLAATSLLARNGISGADSDPSDPTPQSQALSDSQGLSPEAHGQSPQVHIHIGDNLQPQQPMHDVAVTSDREGTRLLRVDSSGMFPVGRGVDPPRQQVCVAPCTTNMTPSGTYMIRGYGITDSPHFGIGDTTRDLKVHTGSSAVGAVGGASLTLGLLSVITGAVFVTAGFLEDSRSSDRSTFLTAGWGTLVGGAALIGVGVVLAVATRTHIYDGDGARLATAQYPRPTLSGLEF